MCFIVFVKLVFNLLTTTVLHAHPVGPPPWRSSERLSWPGHCWQAWRPRSGSSPLWWTASACPWSGARCLGAGLQRQPSSFPEGRSGSGSALLSHMDASHKKWKMQMRCFSISWVEANVQNKAAHILIMYIIFVQVMHFHNHYFFSLTKPIYFHLAILIWHINNLMEHLNENPGRNRCETNTCCKWLI